MIVTTDENVKSKTKILYVYHTFLYISLPFLHDFDVKLPNFTFYGGCNDKIIFLFLNLDRDPRNSTPGGITEF